MAFGKRFFCVLIACLCAAFCFADESAESKYYSWDFTDCAIKDIVYAVSLDSGIPIVCDDTVDGKGDLKFAGNDFDAAFEAFLDGNRLFAKKSDGVWKISRLCCGFKDGAYFLDAFDLNPNQIVEKLCKEFGFVLTYDLLPSGKISVHFKNLNENELIEALARRFGPYEVKKKSGGWHFEKKSETKKAEAFGGTVSFVQDENGIVKADLRDCKFMDALESLAALYGGSEKPEFCMLANGDVRILRSVFTGTGFADTLEKLCAQNGFSSVNADGVFYILPDASAKNLLIGGQRHWEKVSLSFTKPQDFAALVARRIGKIECICLPDETSVLCLINESELKELNQLVADADIKKSIYCVNLKYIKPKDFLEHLPPDFEKSHFFMADDSSSLYFKGTDAGYKNLCIQLEMSDRPVKRISYDLLILQYDETFQNSWTSGVKVNRLALGDRNNLSAGLGSVMSLNMNVLSAFGLNFALELQSAIEENRTKVFADTTLYGVSGKQINFKNTNTYRYRDNNLDPQTGKPIYSGITKEISSGIKLDILGWVSGDGTITSTVTASVSRQGTDTSASTGNPPPTSEKVVTTEVCGKSGQPIVLSGLVQNAESDQQKRTPFLSKIPILGNFFKAKEKTREKSQMVIYLVPHIEDFKDENQKIYDVYWARKKLAGLEAVINGGKND